MTRTFISNLVIFLMAITLSISSIAQGQSLRDLERLSDRRQETKNDWRNIAIASGAIAVIGLLKDDSTLTFAGTAGALYSAYRYEQDRKSQSRLDRARAAYFSRSFFVRDGVRYNRRTVYKNGKKYYQFVKYNPPKKNGRHDNGRRKNGKDSESNFV